MIGTIGVCSNGRTGVITGKADLPWGRSWVGMGTDGYPWSSRHPDILQVADCYDYQEALTAASQRLMDAGILHPIAKEMNKEDEQ